MPTRDELRPNIIGARIKRVEDPRLLAARARLPTIASCPARCTSRFAAAITLHLSTYKLPDAVHVIDQIPRTGSGKIIRFRLRERLAGGGG